MALNKTRPYKAGFLIFPSASFWYLKPAPFCIFDEVDAPFDDTNNDKFNNIIKKFSQDSQFIIITHNKRTMTSTDIIYGITMAEPGVTQVVRWIDGDGGSCLGKTLWHM